MSECTAVSSKLLLGMTNNLFTMSKNSTTHTLIDNLNYLKQLHGDSVYAIGKRAKMSPRTVSNILAREQDKVSIEQAEALASAYGLKGWHLLIDSLPRDLIESPSIAKLFGDFVAASAEGRSHINMIAEREALYSAPKPKK